MEEAAATSSQRKVERKKRALMIGDPELECLNMLPWNLALPQNDYDDTFSLFVGCNQN
ncbi:putative DEAD-box ATP-dependent RNA helicase 13-like [Sesbania bispinosa]|nr:putative DEAD-box ATP-dependent RNA helicase 13-like [Sesbania bispinosa]